MNRNIADLVTATAFDRDGEKLGSVTEVYINDTTGQPDFVEVAHGLFGMDSSIVPLRGHRLDGENLQLAFSKDLIKDAPDIDDEAHLSDEEQERINAHFGLTDTTGAEEVYEPFESPGTLAPGVAVHGFGDHSPLTDASADRLRAESDHRLGLDRTPEDRAARGTSAHGMSDEPREQYRDYETAERPYAKEARERQNEEADRGRAEATRGKIRGSRPLRYREDDIS
ncbi:PRC-barrel domain-containing protein [Corynebacterium sp.]|uniref:PRC-barrel domain-containing protein n=1 Tax=Corynebacterium sp. TaxID=1720 RepID=UPI0019CB64C9|nr:PRC-barrel domain containing protein [Corynebacterium sp.]